MSHDLNEVRPIGGLNMDDGARIVPPTDYVYAKNIRNAVTAINRGGNVTNVKGNLAPSKYTLPYNANTFPTGTNKVIGSVEDTKYSTVIFFVWNSLGKHQILRYYRNLTSPANPYGEIQQIIQYNFGWTKRTKIDSANIVYGVTETGDDDEETGDLLYWCDPVPKKINLTKANVCVKEKCWDIMLPVTVVGNIASNITFTFKNFAGTTIFSKTVQSTKVISESADIAYQTSGNFVLVSNLNLDLTGVTNITTTGSSVAGNNRTYTIVSFTYIDSLNRTAIEVSETISTTTGFEAGTITWNAPFTRNNIIDSIADAFNADTASPIEAEACECKLEFCEKVAGTVWTIEDDADAVLIVPSNWYGATLIDRFFDRCKWQPLNAPRGTFEKDANYEPNYVQRKVFQFRLEYDYDDLERSALGVWSQIPINNLGCDGTSDKSYNYIDVDFNDSLIANEQTLVLLKRIWLVARELNTGADRSVIELDPCDFLDYVDGEWYVHYNFYNDIISSAIDSARAAKLYDNVPLETNDERFAKNRIVEGGILEGYDAPECVGAKVQMEFVAEAQKPLRKITGKIRIMTYGLSGGEVDINDNASPEKNQRCFYNAFPALRKYPFWEPSSPGDKYQIRRGGIFHDVTRTDESDGGNFAFFGGGGYGTGGQDDFGIRAGMESSFDQRIPEGGFPVYCAGTPYLTISRQIDVGLSTDDAGALDTSTPEKRTAIGNYLSCDGGTCGDLYSTFELLVPDDATYVIRLASHWCSFDNGEGDKLGKGFMYNLSTGTNYQQTSTNVHCVLSDNGTMLYSKELTVTVSGSDVYAGEFVVMDLAPPFDASMEVDGLKWLEALYWAPINGYLYAGQNTASTDMRAELFNGIPVEKTLVAYGRTSATNLFRAQAIGTLVGVTNQPTGWNEVCVTDHNGYWFGIGGAMCITPEDIAEDPTQVATFPMSFPMAAFQTKLGSLNNVDFIRTKDYVFSEGTLTDYVNKTLSTVTLKSPNVTLGRLYHGLIPTNVPNIKDYCFTFLDGLVTDQNGLGVPDIAVVYEWGQTSKTNTDGAYSLPAWSDMVEANKGLFGSQTATFTPMSDANRLVDDLVIESSPFCLITYPNGQTKLPQVTPFDPAATGYNFDVHFPVPDFSINEANNPSQKAHKRGGNYTYVGRGYDDAGRLCSCFFLNEMYVPFITEDIGKYDIEDFSGNIYPSGTFKYGKPTIKLLLDNATVFPSWMKYFQLMRVKNSIYGRYLQWVANRVTYVASLATDNTPEIQTAFSNGDATAIKISLSNILTYEAQNNNSEVSYQYQPGDRLRLIADRDIEYIDGLNDFEITSYDAITEPTIASTTTSVTVDGVTTATTTPPAQPIHSFELIIRPENFLTEIKSGFLFEIYNPKSVATDDQQIFYEVGQVIKVNNGIPVTYSIPLTNGDTYWRGRLITVNDEATKFAAAYPVVIEDASVSDFYPSEAQDIGRPGLIDPAFKQVYAPTKMRCSNAFLPSTAINGLSSFEELNQVELDRSNGEIERLLQKENTVIAVTSEREISTYIEVVSFQQADVGSGVLAVANQYFGTQYPHSKRLGTDHPSSVRINDGQAFGLQSKRGEVWRYQGDGELSISEVKMINYFKQLEQDGVSDATAVYDRYHKEYILTVKREYQFATTIFSAYRSGADYIITLSFGVAGTNPLPVEGETITFQYLDGSVWRDLEGEVTFVNVVSGTDRVTISVVSSHGFKAGVRVNLIYSIPETVVFFNGDNGVTKDRWVRFDDRTPERWEQCGSELVSFKDGLIWLENVNLLYGNFYGVQYNSKITPVFNKNPDLIKVFNALWLSQQQADGGCNWFSDSITNTVGQLSRLNKNNWRKREQDWYIDFKRDLTDVTVTNPIVNGRRLRCTDLTVEMTNDGTGEFSLYSFRANWTESARTSK